MTDCVDEALALMASPTPGTNGLLGNAADIYPELVRRGVRPGLVTDQTSAHDPVNGYLPQGWTLDRWMAERESDPDAVARAAGASMAVHVRAMLDFQRAGGPVVEYGINIRQVAFDQGVADAFAFPGFVPAYIRPLFCRGVGPFRWVALSGDPEDIYKTDAKVKELMPDDAHLHRWLDMARDRIHFQGLPARICWVGLGDRHRLGLAFNDMVARGELKAPVVIGRDHLDSGSVASPNRETEAMRDGTAAVSAWPLLNALLTTALGALPQTLCSYYQQTLQAPLRAGLVRPRDYFIVAGLGMLANMMLGLIVQGALVRATMSAAEGERATLGQSLATGLRRALPLLGLAILMGLGIGIGFLLLIVPGVLLYLMWSVAVPVTVVDRRGVIESLGRSGELTKGARGTIFALFVILWAVMIGAEMVTGAAVVAIYGIQGFARVAQDGLPLAFFVVTGLIATAVAVFASAIPTALYVELRDWKEGPSGEALSDIFAYPLSRDLASLRAPAADRARDDLI